MPAEPALILWDVDHTLVSFAGLGRELHARAFQEIIGRPAAQVADLAGRTDRAIVIDTLRRNGIDRPESLLPAFYAALPAAAVALDDRMRRTGRVLPGARAAVESLVGDGVVQSVVTGNLPSLARLKLACCELTDLLDLTVGGYGDDDSDRAVLVALAVKRAEAAYGVTFAPARVVVIGDTVHDVRGARDAGVRAVGVATGATTAPALAAAGADAVLADLTDPAALHAAVHGDTVT
ncbi:putative phosphatase [Frankia torreyi]|uniref:Putative phosphatase n=1 Tax=Frankia torreyi TaxID=1856 RepID=A0A0D8B500_9ACTN|nr:MULTISPECIES: HAD hydrolase-like protein [Frankia]KJE19358.1 putative phosphatase [Frankia torreyi]KQC35009.1 haloacid dehalogenase [Frankia sp. ACN1ag]KQM02636.1 putative phosphatase [Frankia sp. CpI1-P]